MWKSHIQIVQKFNLNNILNLYFFYLNDLTVFIYKTSSGFTLNMSNK